MTFDLATRQIHVDFHTGPWVPDIVEEATPLVGVRVALRWDADRPPRPGDPAARQRGQAFEVRDGFAAFELTSTAGHDLIVLE